EVGARGVPLPPTCLLGVRPEAWCARARAEAAGSAGKPARARSICCDVTSIGGLKYAYTSRIRTSAPAHGWAATITRTTTGPEHAAAATGAEATRADRRRAPAVGDGQGAGRGTERGRRSGYQRADSTWFDGDDQSDGRFCHRRRRRHRLQRSGQAEGP